MIAAMSFGAISKEAKIALAMGASLAGTATNTGEGGMLPEERKYASKLIAQYASGRFGVSAEYLNNSEAIEIKIGQGAKSGMGGHLLGEKVTADVSRIRMIPEGTDALSPARHMLMTVPGVAMFYGGMVKKENVLNTIFLSLIAFSITSVIWVIYGYPLAFGTDLMGIIGNPANLLMNGISVDALAPLAPTIPLLVYVAFQMTFAAITVALIAGAVVGRMKFSAWLAFVPLWITLVYLPIAHWVWGGGFLAQLGALDFAGGTVVHLNCGIAALALILLLGRRKDTRLLPHQLGYSVLGAAFLWFGWFGFNAGSALSAGGLAGSAFIVTNTAAAAAMILSRNIPYIVFSNKQDLNNASFDENFGESIIIPTIAKEGIGVQDGFRLLLKLIDKNKQHVKILEKNKIVKPTGDKYGKLYFLSEDMERNYDIFEEIWEKIGIKQGEKGH